MKVKITESNLPPTKKGYKHFRGVCSGFVVEVFGGASVNLSVGDTCQAQPMGIQDVTEDGKLVLSAWVR